MIIMPPQRRFARPRSWNTFERLFSPIAKADDSLLRDTHEFYISAKGSRHWWTVVEGDTGGLSRRRIQVGDGIGGIVQNQPQFRIE